jgi:hypothetical protein
VARKAAEARAITPEEADKKISQAVEDLLLLRSRQVREELAAKESPAPKTTASSKKRKTIFDHLKENNPDLDI